MFEDYFKEEYGRDCLSNESGFMAYRIEGLECHIADFYVKPERRKSIEAKKLFTTLCNLAKESGCQFMSGVVGVGPGREEKATRLLRCYFALGFQIYSAKNNQVVVAFDLKKEKYV